MDVALFSAGHHAWLGGYDSATAWTPLPWDWCEVSAVEADAVRTPDGTVTVGRWHRALGAQLVRVTDGEVREVPGPAVTGGPHWLRVLPSGRVFVGSEGPEGPWLLAPGSEQWINLPAQDGPWICRSGVRDLPDRVLQVDRDDPARVLAELDPSTRRPQPAPDGTTLPCLDVPRGPRRRSFSRPALRMADPDALPGGLLTGEESFGGRSGRARTLLHAAGPGPGARVHSRRLRRNRTAMRHFLPADGRVLVVDDFAHLYTTGPRPGRWSRTPLWRRIAEVCGQRDLRRFQLLDAVLHGGTLHVAVQFGDRPAYYADHVVAASLDGSHAELLHRANPGMSVLALA
ncbi:hypothetical protein [Kitasatospora cineracea]|uniref:Uncharacterized protein n=1 Tax=Kitasatospora cineracea TaxID=88074 RepID=A0A3N4RH52_9ACTN|nr:hypothetical protein [Kitasatospora cineracea]RPE27687.1 hypothetical protein EDD38_6974 [Kitasatospora cineracea]